MKCRKKTGSKNLTVAKTNKGKPMLLWQCAVCDSKKSRFIKQQGVSGLLSSLELQVRWSKKPLLGDILF